MSMTKDASQKSQCSDQQAERGDAEKLKKHLSISGFVTDIERRGRSTYPDPTDFRRLIAASIHLFTQPNVPDQVEDFLMKLGRKLEAKIDKGEQLTDEPELIEDFRRLLGESDKIS